MQHRPWKKPKFQPTVLIAVVVMLLILFSLVGYFFMLPELERAQRAEQLLADVELQQAQWRATKPRGYRYVVDRECYCPGEDTSPSTVTVVSDVLVDASDAYVITVDEMFRIIADAASAANHIEVVFDARFGYPAQVTIDDLAGGRASIEIYRIRDFEVTDYGRSGDSG